MAHVHLIGLSGTVLIKLIFKHKTLLYTIDMFGIDLHIFSTCITFKHYLKIIHIMYVSTCIGFRTEKTVEGSRWESR